MSRRSGDFTKPVKEELAARAGYRCSKPSCRALTTGPSESRSSGYSNIGVAAHIAAASPGGPRYDPEQTAEERGSRANGIWLCSTDAKAIDDEERLGRDLLEAWRDTAEELADSEKGRPDPSAPSRERQLVSYKRYLDSLDRASEEILDFLENIGAARAWGAGWELVRLLLTELALNAFEHGGVKTVELESSDHAVRLRHGGMPFGKSDLTRGGRGGNRALSDFDQHADGSFTLRYRRDVDTNEWTVVDEVAHLGGDVPCSMSFPEAERRGLAELVERELERLAGCEEFHVYHNPFWSYSHWLLVVMALGRSLDSQVLVVHGLPADHPVAKMIAEEVPGSRFPDAPAP